MNNLRNAFTRLILSKQFSSYYKNDICKYEMDKTRLQNLIEQQFIGLNMSKSKSNCDIDRFILQYEIDELTVIKNKINTGSMSYDEIISAHKRILESYTNYLNKVNKISRNY
jgi:hypothetical protein